MKNLMISALVLTAATTGQMSKRMMHRYDRARFERTAPALGKMTPGLTLLDLDGKSHSLTAVRGKRLVLIGGGFT